MYDQINPHDLRRCPLPPVQEVEEDESEDAGAVLGNQQAFGHLHRARRKGALASAFERVRGAGGKA